MVNILVLQFVISQINVLFLRMMLTFGRLIHHRKIFRKSLHTKTVHDISWVLQMRM